MNVYNGRRIREGHAWLVGQTNAGTFKISALTAYMNVDRLKTETQTN
jgi:hypothetical protein